jgi:hypothetical protein
MQPKRAKRVTIKKMKVLISDIDNGAADWDCDGAVKFSQWLPSTPKNIEWSSWLRP